MKRPRAAALLLAILTATTVGCSGGTAQAPLDSASTHQSGPLTVRGGGMSLLVSVRDRQAWARGDIASTRRRAHSYLHRHTVWSGSHWRIRLAWSRPAAALVAAAIRGQDTSVRVPAAVDTVQLTLPTTRQIYRNDCEATALSMMLGGRVGQLHLQHLLPIADPYLPQIGPGKSVWGDPELGFVGNVRGGGYGVYDRPLLALARRYDPGATNLTGTSVARIVAALRGGRPVVAWIQFGPSIPRSWTTPTGRVVNANYAEHTVTLTGWKPGEITYNNPWTGTRETFTIDGFTRLWHTLGNRAIAGSSVFGKTGA